MLKRALFYIQNRPVVTILGAGIGFFSIFLMYGAIVAKDINEYFHNNGIIIVSGALLISIPLMIGGTRKTLKSDILDEDVLRRNKKEFEDFSNYADRPILKSVFRLYLEAADQRSYATKNLSIGIGLTFVATLVAITLIFSARSGEMKTIEHSAYIYNFLLPRAGVVIFIQGIASLFLKWYAGNVRSISSISDKIYYSEMMLEKLKLAHTDPAMKSKLLESMCLFHVEQIGPRISLQERIDRYIVKKLANNTKINIGAAAPEDKSEKEK